jgi:hypothetical protein
MSHSLDSDKCSSQASSALVDHKNSPICTISLSPAWSQQCALYALYATAFHSFMFAKPFKHLAHPLAVALKTVLSHVHHMRQGGNTVSSISTVRLLLSACLRGHLLDQSSPYKHEAVTELLQLSRYI